ncbi:MAG: hypothetical protein KDI48_19830, partial [Xanthomonadales bacterium]|nr:hypothetical protein [Xanthomonadales bacterium]
SEACTQFPPVELDAERVAEAASAYAELNGLVIESSQAWGAGDSIGFTLQFEAHAKDADGVERHHELRCWPGCLPPILHRSVLFPGQSQRTVLNGDISIDEAREVVAFVQAALLSEDDQYPVSLGDVAMQQPGPLPITGLARDGDGYVVDLNPPASAQRPCQVHRVRIARPDCDDGLCAWDLIGNEIVSTP